MEDNNPRDSNIPYEYDGWLDWFKQEEMASTDTTDYTPPAAKYATPNPILPEEPDWDTWTDNPFDLIWSPFGAILEPEGYAAMRALKQRRTTSYAARMPHTYALAQSIYDSVVVREVWGAHMRPKKNFGKKDEHGRSLQDVTWLTHTEGRWVGGKNHKQDDGKRKGEQKDNETSGQGKKWGNGFPDPRLELLDVIKTLADPNFHAVGNKDIWNIRLQHRMVRNVRIDIDLDTVFDRNDLASLQGEIKIVHDAFRAFGLNVGVMRTGNRGIQAIAPIPSVPRAHAGMLVHALRHALRGAVRCWLAKDFQSNLDGIMRLPLGRHAWTNSVSCMLAPDAKVLPFECQAEVVSAALNGPTTMGRVWAEEVDVFLASRRIPPWADVPAHLLAEFAAQYPDGVLIRLLDDACVQVCTTPVVGSRSSLEALCHSETPSPNCDGHADEVLVPVKPALGIRIPVNKTRAWAVLNAGFAAGMSFAYYMNLTVNGVKGRNAIGMSLVAHDGDVEAARSWLHQQAQQTGRPTEAVVKDRLGLIDRCLTLDRNGSPRNNTYTTLQQFLVRLQTTKPHRTMDGDVLVEEIALANCVTDLMVERQRGSAVKRRAFTGTALEIVRQAVSLLLMEMRQADDGVARVSYRSLASRMCVGAAAVRATEVARQMAWIVSGPNCLVECFLIVPGASRSAFNPITYSIGQDLNALLHIGEEEPE